MKAGDVVFVRGKSIVSHAIRLFDPGEFSHVCVAVSPTHVVEAEYSTKVRIVPIEYKDVEIVDLKLTDLQRDLLVHLAIQLVGKWYDFYTIFGIMFDKKDWNVKEALICTEVAAALLLGIGFLEDEVSLKPNEFYRYLKEK